MRDSILSRLAALLALMLVAAGCAGPLDLSGLARRIDVQPGHIRIRPAEDGGTPTGQPDTLPSAGAGDQAAATQPPATAIVAGPVVSATASTGPTAAPSRTPAPRPTAAPPALPSATGMVRIQGGRYTVGATQPDSYQQPAQELELATYWIDKYLATNAQYKTFVDQTGHAAPPGWSGSNYPAEAAKQPVQGLTWNDARTYCAWQGKRLPGEAEWEAAGRGSGANPPLYPWGTDSTAGGQTYQLPETNTYEVGSLAWNRSASGVYDLLDAVWQWVDRPYAPVPPDRRLVRGGRFGLPWDLAHREAARPDDANFASSAGVRCAASHVAGE